MDEIITKIMYGRQVP